nr:agmatine deiminase [Alteribacillus sp. YIM 98480]
MVTSLPSTPKHDGFRMPGEFEPHTGTWLLWPMRTDTWHSGAKPAQQTFVNIASAISQFEPVTIGVHANQFENARNLLPDNVRVVELSSNDAWMRDIGPTFVKNDRGEVRGIDWGFNAWGGLEEGLYFPWDLDLQVPQKVLEMEQIPRYDARDLVMEGGAIAVDGEGTLITTEECLLHPNRNPHLSKHTIEQKLKAYLNIDKIIWLEHGMVGDETNGHVDEVVFFVRPGEIAISWTDDPNHPQYSVLQEAYHKLVESTDAKGRRFTIHKITLPEQATLHPEESKQIDFARDSFDRLSSMQFVSTYINCYLCNGGVVIPAFNDPQDEEAKAIFKDLFPDRKIVQVYSRELSIGGGNIHCITQQQPSP